MLNSPQEQPTPVPPEDAEASPATRDFVLAHNIAAPDSDPPARLLRRWQRASQRRVGIPAILLSADVVAFAVAVALNGVLGPKTLALFGIIVLLFHVGGLYRPRLSLSLLDDAPAIIGRALAGGAATMVLIGLSDGVAATRRLVLSALFGALALLTRSIAYAVVRWVRRRGGFQQAALLLGAGTLAGSLAECLGSHPEYGLRPVGMLDDEPLLSEQERAVPLLGGYSALTKVVLEHRVDVVIVTYGSLREPHMVPLLRACDRHACEIYFVPRLYEMHTVTRDTEVLWGVPLVRMRRAAFRSGTWAAKRVTDAVISSLALTVLLPLLLVCGLLSRCETGSVLFRQTRIGLDGRPFTLFKFCSLRPQEESESNTHWNIGADPRVGPIGRLLRATSLDELPQLVNVLRGDMSLVGPRPERPYFVDEFGRRYPWYSARHRVPVGLTGWAQVHGLRGDTSIADRARFDNFYIENWSMWGDIKILIRTAAQVIRGAGR
jgi:exopolysaccharide biosynthesis polyprenyl glycosylphosphotransferase